jgi:hypothetical protein
MQAEQRRSPTVVCCSPVAAVFDRRASRRGNAFDGQRPPLHVGSETAAPGCCVHGRYGNNALNGDWELGITSNTSAPPQQQRQRTWTSTSGTGEPFTFEITKIPASLVAPAATSGTFTIGGSNVQASYTDITSYEPNAIKIWARSTTTGSGLTINDLKITTPGVPGETVFPGTVINVSQGSGTGFQEIIIAGIDFQSMSGGTVTLEGSVAMRFGNAPAPRGSSLQFHVIPTYIPWVDVDVDSNNDWRIDPVRKVGVVSSFPAGNTALRGGVSGL